MTEISDYLAGYAQPDLTGGRNASEPGYDELATPGGGVRPAWRELAAHLDKLGRTGLLEVSSNAIRLLEDDGVTYNLPAGPTAAPTATPAPPTTPTWIPTSNPTATLTSTAQPTTGRPLTSTAQPTTGGPPTSTPQPTTGRPLPSSSNGWRLDPIPVVLDDATWADIERGLIQAAELLDAIASDIYGEQRLLASRLIPPDIVYLHDGFLRNCVGATGYGRRHLFLGATDLGRTAQGDWAVISHRTQAPSGMGYAMENRRVVSRVLPELFRDAGLHRLSAFFAAMRVGLADVGAMSVEDPRMVILTPGTRSETAFDQAYLASLLGFPLVTGNDLTVRDGRLWMRVLGRLEPVDVVIRRVDAGWSDPLELRPESQLGVPALLEASRRGSVTVANSLGCGVIENPALLGLLPRLCDAVLGEDLRLPPVTTYWCGNDKQRRHVLTHLDSLVLRPISRSRGRSAVGSSLSRSELAHWRTRIEADPARYVGQELLPLSSTPTVTSHGLQPRRVIVRGFVAAHGTSYVAMPGGIARVLSNPAFVADTSLEDDTSAAMITKDVWVLTGRPSADDVDRRLPEGRLVLTSRSSPAMVPRVLEDLFWFGRYAERAEDLLRLLLAVRSVIDEFAGRTESLATRSLNVLLPAVTRVTGTFPGFFADDVDAVDELRSMLVDAWRPGTVAQSILSLTNAAQGVRDQLSGDVWSVLGAIDRAFSRLELSATDRGEQWIDTAVDAMAGLLALSGITSENMVRDVGWYLLDAGRGIERALQLVALLRSTITILHPPTVDDHVVEAVLLASESIITHRRRYRGRKSMESVLQLLVTDAENPRSLGYQIDRIGRDLRSVPGVGSGSRPARLLGALGQELAAADLTALTTLSASGGRPERVVLGEFCGIVNDHLERLSDAIDEQFFTQQLPPRPLWRPRLSGASRS